MPSANDPTLSQNPGDPLDELLAEYLVQIEAGNAPDREAFIAAHPEFANELKEFFSAQDAVAGHSSTAPHRSASNLPRIRYIGDYELLEEIARGGMGVVFKAKQLSVGRTVALKMMLSGMNASDAEKRRFQAEVEAAANLDHPNIVPIYEVGEHEGQPYFAMRYLEGPTLKGVTRGTPRQEAERLATIAKAVHFAHQRGILHRDLKPGNILTDAAGQPFVTDFGLARKLDADESMTQTGAILGTPAYMAPEQAAGKKAISLAADVYSLGVILFERLTGRLPFQGDSQQEVLRQVQEQEPPRLSSITPGLPKDSETICLKCLRKEPGERYGTADELSADLQRWLDGKPIVARPVGNVERAVKWVRRNPVVTSLTAAVFLAMAVGTTVSWVKYREAKDNANVAQLARDAEEVRADERDAALARERERGRERDTALANVRDRERRLEEVATELRYNLGTTHMMLANAAYDSNNFVLAQDYLGKVPIEQRKFEWGYRQSRITGGLFTLYGHKGSVNSVSCSPDGARMVTGSDDSTAKVWDARTGGSLLDLKGHTALVNSVAYSPDSMRIVTGSGDGTAKVWDARTGRSLLELKGHKSNVKSAAFNPDGTRIVTGGSDSTAKVWDARTGQPLFELKGHADSVNSVSFSPNGTRIVTGSVDKSAKVWDARSGQLLLELKGHRDGLTSVSFSPDGAQIVTGCWDQSAKVWDARNGQLLLDLNGHTEGVTSVSYSPDGTRIVTGTTDQTARVWDARTGQSLLDLKGHTEWVTSVSFSPDGARIVTGSADQTAKLWDARSSQVQLEFKEHATEVTSLSFSPDGTLIVTGSNDPIAKMWDARTGQRLLDLKGHTQNVNCASFSPDGKRIATASSDLTAKLWDARTGRTLLDLKGHSHRVTSISFSPDGARIVTGSGDNTAKVWNAKNGQSLLDLKGHTDGVSSVEFSPDGARIVTGSLDNTAKVWDARSGKLLLDLVGHVSWIASVSFSPDGARIVTGSLDHTAKVWNARTGQSLLDLKGHADRVESVSFSPDGTRIVTGSEDCTAKVWDVKTGQCLLDLKGHKASVTMAEFSPDGTRIATGSKDQTAKVWDSKTSELSLDLSGHTNTVRSVSYSPDGTRIVTGSKDQMAKVWDAQTGRSLLDLTGLGDVLNVSFFPDGRRIFASSWMNAIVWDARTGQVTSPPNPQETYHDEFSPDGRFFAHPDGNRVVIVPTKTSCEELKYRLFWTARDSRQSSEAFLANGVNDNRFAKRFHLGRLLSFPQNFGNVELLNYRSSLTGDVCLTVRSGFHTPAVANEKYVSPTLHLLAASGDRLAQRLVAQELIRDGKPEKAVPLLFWCLASRMLNSPPVEELLIAKAYQKMNRPEEAKKYYGIATEWLDRPRKPMAAANVITHAINPWNALGEAFKPVDDPRHNTFDWESWYECDVFRAELAKVIP